MKVKLYFIKTDSFFNRVHISPENFKTATEYPLQNFSEETYRPSLN